MYNFDKQFSDFQEVWCCDFEFAALDGNRPEVKCMVAIELHSGREIKLFREDLYRLDKPPFDIGKNSLFIAYYAPDEISCFLSLGWELPKYILDLCVEFKNILSGIEGCKGLIDCLKYYGLSSIDTLKKDSMRELALREGDYTDKERRDLLDYCKSDVDALVKLLPQMIGSISLPYALIRGEYTKATAQIERNGVPISATLLTQIKEQWPDIKAKLIEDVDKDYGVFDNGSFNNKKFRNFIDERGYRWPRNINGSLKTDKDTLKQLAKKYPELEYLKELLATIRSTNLLKLPVGVDERNRTNLWCFGTKTSRNAPSTSEFIFGPATWVRYLIKPKEGFALAYIDYSQQEFAIAAYMSGDKKMQEAYESGDPYLTFGKQSGLIPAHATKETHKADRDKCKMLVLAMNYGMAAESLSDALDISKAEAQQLIDKYHKTYGTYSKWSESIINHGDMTGNLKSVLGWQVSCPYEAKWRSMANFPMQANGAEMLRLSCIEGLRHGIKICAPIHDAVLIEAPIDEIEDKIATMREVMCQASKFILDGAEVKTDREIYCYPETFQDKRGEEMFNKIVNLLKPE